MSIKELAVKFITGKTFNRVTDHVSTTYYTDGTEAWVYEGTPIAKRLAGAVYINEHSKYISKDRVTQGIIHFKGILTDNPYINRIYAVIIECRIYKVPCYTIDGINIAHINKQ